MTETNWMSADFKCLCFDAFQELAPDGIIVVNRQGQITSINQPYVDRLGIQAQDALGKKVREVIPISEMTELMERDVTDRDIIRFLNTSELTSNSKEQMVLLSRTPVKNPDGETVGAIGYVRFYNQCREEFYKMDNLYVQMSASTEEVFQTAVEKTYAALGSSVNETTALERLSLQLKYYQEELQSIRIKDYPSIIGRSPVFLNMKEKASRLAKTSFSVLLTGESGTGKEVIANLIHTSSDRMDKPLITINCAAIPAELLESELFGYTKGAFTGANREGKLGKIAAADGGSIFLDEIGDMPLPLQAKLLRVLENKEIEPIGATKAQKVDVRFISATRKNLEQMVSEGTFREDLYFRINELRLQIPPLRERVEDIPLLAKYMLLQINRKYKTNVIISDVALKTMEGYYWPGNIRELNNVIKGAYCMAENGKIEISNLPQHIVERSGAPELLQRAVLPLQEQMDLTERQLLLDALKRFDGNLNLTAKKLGLSRSTLYKKLAKHNISPRGNHLSEE